MALDEIFAEIRRRGWAIGTIYELHGDSWVICLTLANERHVNCSYSSIGSVNAHGLAEALEYCMRKMEMAEAEHHRAQEKKQAFFNRYIPQVPSTPLVRRI